MAPPLNPPQRREPAKEVTTMFTRRAAHDSEKPRAKRRFAAEYRTPIQHLEIRVLQHVGRLTSVEPAAGHGPAHAFGVVPFERRTKIGGRCGRRGSGFSNDDECREPRIHMTNDRGGTANADNTVCHRLPRYGIGGNRDAQDA